MSLPRDVLPVYGPDHELLYCAPLSSVPRLLESGRVTAVGTRRRIRSLLAVSGAEEFLRLARPMGGQKYSHCHESDDNVRGVWTFRRIAYAP